MLPYLVFGLILRRTQKKKGVRAEPESPQDYLSGHDQNIGRNLESKSNSDEALNGNQEYLPGNWSKGHSCCNLATNLADYTHVLGLLGVQNDDLGHFLEENLRKFLRALHGFS